jgi:protein-S-isoprenylcysteine O-methyltransferase Ste14
MRAACHNVPNQAALCALRLPGADYTAWREASRLELRADYALVKSLKLVSWMTAISSSVRPAGPSVSWLPTGPENLRPHAVVRHPIYASYLLIQSGYLLQSLSLRNLAVVTFASACNIALALAGVRPLARSPASLTYRERARWRLIPDQR